MPSGDFSRPAANKNPSQTKKKLATKTVAPRTDAQTSGRNYGIEKAESFKKTPVFKRSVGAAKPARQTDATSSGPGYGKKSADAYRSLASQAVKSAKADKPFD